MSDHEILQAWGPPPLALRLPHFCLLERSRPDVCSGIFELELATRGIAYKHILMVRQVGNKMRYIRLIQSEIPGKTVVALNELEQLLGYRKTSQYSHSVLVETIGEFSNINDKKYYGITFSLKCPKLHLPRVYEKHLMSVKNRC